MHKEVSDETRKKLSFCAKGRKRTEEECYSIMIHNPRRKSVALYYKDGSLIKTYISMNEAHKLDGFGVASIYQWIRNKVIPTNSNYYWRYITDEEKFKLSSNINLILLEKAKKEISKPNNYYRKIICCDENNKFIKTYDSIHDAHRKSGYAISGIRRWLKKETVPKNKYIWKYADEKESN